MSDSVLSSDATSNGAVKDLPYLNLGCGLIHLPCERPAHHLFVPEDIYTYPHWLNVDKNAASQPDQVIDLFTYPWPLESNAYGGALLSHIIEHIPHEIKISDEGLNLNGVEDHDDLLTLRAQELDQMQDGWFAFFAELYRILTSGAIVHILSPYAWSQGAVTDPSHTRLITEQAFHHSLAPDPSNHSFHYETGGVHFEVVGQPRHNITSLFMHLVPNDADPPATKQEKYNLLTYALQTQINVAYDIYVQLRVVK